MSATLRQLMSDIPSAQVHGAKVVNYFELSKKKCFWGCFFWCRVYGVECKGGDLLGGVPPSTKQTSGKCPNQIGASSQSLGNLFRKQDNLIRKQS